MGPPDIGPGWAGPGLTTRRPLSPAQSSAAWRGVVRGAASGATQREVRPSRYTARGCTTHSSSPAWRGAARRGSRTARGSERPSRSTASHRLQQALSSYSATKVLELLTINDMLFNKRAHLMYHIRTETLRHIETFLNFIRVEHR